ncbi:unnamed protein product [Oreochromis niloticus]|nr:unnamed protein product [Mustela putorius furo]
MHSTDVHHVSQSVRGKPRELVECYWCGGAHFAKDCVFKESTCHNCKKKGHLAKKCRSTKEKPKKEWKTKPKLNTYHLQSIAPEEDECVFNIFNLVGFNRCRAEPIYATIQVNGKELQMEVDTGASASVISQATYYSLWHSVGAPAHQESEISLRQYTGECIPLLGAIEVHAAYQGQETAATLLVVKGEGPSLLGRDLLQKICLNWREIRYGWPATVEQDHLKPYAKRQQELSGQDGCILWGSRVIVPPPGRSQIIEVLHEAHSGISRMESLARSFVWWSGMDSALEEKVKACSQCQSNQKMSPPAPLHPWEWPSRPWSRLHLDFAGPILGHMFLVLVDAHSEWLDAHITPTITALVVTDTLWRIFATHGLPEAVVTDNGPTFTSGIFQEFMERNGIRHIRTAPYHPASNGLAECAVETLKDGLKKMLGLSIEKRLCRFLFQYRITPHTTTGLSPAELLMGRKPRSHLDLLRSDVGAKVTQSQVELLDGRRVRRHKDHVRARTDGAGKRAQSCSRTHGGDGAVDIVGPPSGSPEGEVVSAAPEIGIGSSVSSEGLVEQSKSPEPNLARGAQQAPSHPTAGPRRSKRQHKPPDRLNC